MNTIKINVVTIFALSLCLLGGCKKNSDIEQKIPDITLDTSTVLQVDTDKIELSSSESNIEIKVKTNISFSVEVESNWIKYTDKERIENTDNIVTTKLLFNISENTQEESRNSKIYLINNEYKIKETITIYQEGINHISKIYEVKEAGTLPSIIDDKLKYKISELKLSGNLNGTDIKFIREMAGRDVNGNETPGILTILDITDTKIISGGDYYCDANYFDNIKGYTNDYSIGRRMFYECNLQEIKLPQNIQIIDEYAFSYCKINSIDIPESVTDIRNSAFLNSSLKSATFSNNNNLYLGERVFMNCDSLESILLPENLEAISDDMFLGCNSLTNINLPNEINSIGSSAFWGCESLESIDIPQNITRINIRTFYGCSSLKHIKLPDNLKEIDMSAFEICSSLEYIDLPQSLTNISRDAFKDCFSLKEIIIPSEMTNSINGVFKNCYSLERIIFKAKRKTLWSYELSELYNIKYLSLPQTLENIQRNNLRDNILEIYCNSINPPIVDKNNKLASNCKVYVPKESIENYKTSDFWKDYTILPIIK